MAVQVLDGVAAQWADHVGDDVPILASRPWIAATLERLTSRRLTFLTEVDGRRGGLQAAVVDNPAAGEMVNLYRMLLADLRVWKFPEAALAVREGLRARTPPAGAWVPHLAVLYPGFDTFVAARGEPTPALTAALVDATLAWAAEHGMRAVSFPYVRADTSLPPVLAERDFAAIPLTYRSRLMLPDSFGDYVASLSKNGRSQVTRERRQLAAAGVRTERRDIDDAWADVLALRCDLVERYGQEADSGAEEANMRTLISCFGADRTRLYCSVRDDRIVGFSLYVIWRGTWYASYTGTYQSPQTRSVYFDHLCYAPIADAISEGAREVDLGIGAWEGKRRRGCELTSIDLWVRGLDPAVDQAVRLAGSAMRREVGW